jgi:hypothetical protein
MQIEMNRKFFMDEQILISLFDVIEKFHTLVSSFTDAFCAWDDSKNNKRNMTDLSQ